jgi:hypothetical protein
MFEFTGPLGGKRVCTPADVACDAVGLSGDWSAAVHNLGFYGGHKDQYLFTVWADGRRR